MAFSLQEKLDIKKDKKGMVVVQGAVVKQATNSKELFALFEEGTKNRHVASTSKLGVFSSVSLSLYVWLSSRYVLFLVCLLSEFPPSQSLSFASWFYM